MVRSFKGYRGWVYIFVGLTLSSFLLQHLFMFFMRCKKNLVPNGIEFWKGHIRQEHSGLVVLHPMAEATVSDYLCP